jgi:hypothetical protein
MTTTAGKGEHGAMPALATRPRPPVVGRRWSRRPRQVLLLLHILSSVGWWGAAVTVAGFALTAVVTDDPALTRALLTAVGVAVWITVAGALTAATTGILLGLGSRWGVIRYRWVVVKEAIAVVMLVTDLLVVRPDVVKALAGTMPRPALLGPTVAHVVFLTVATILSVFKPWGPVRSGGEVIDRLDVPV